MNNIKYIVILIAFISIFYATFFLVFRWAYSAYRPSIYECLELGSDSARNNCLIHYYPELIKR